MPTKFQLITELYDQTVQSVTGSYQSWTGFLRAACYNYKCPFDDQILIYAQRPDATAVLEMERWNRQFGRWVNRGAKSIAVFGDDGQNCLKLYFDVSDTHASRFARPLPIWTMHPAFEPEVIETLEATFGNLAEKENLADAVRSACHNAVADNITDYLQDLRDCREDSLLEELDDLNLEVFYRDALEVSVAYMLMTRLGLPADEYFSPDEFAHVYEFNTPTTINALGIATSDIAEMGLREISRTVMQAQRDQFFANREKSRYDDHTEQHETPHERSEQHGDHLQDAGWLSGAEPADAADAGGTSGQVRGTAESVPEEAPQGALHQPQDQRQADGVSGRDRADRAEDGGADRGADGESRGRDGGTESDRSPALDGADEQSPAQRGGTGTQRPDLRLTTEEPTEAGSDELPAFVDHSADYVLLDRLRADCDYFLGAGGRSEKHLWAGNVHAQIKKMRELYDALPEKPEWLTAEAIDRYAAQMAAPYQVAAYHHIENGFDDKLDYQTLEEAEAAAQGYVAGTMEEDGFAYDGAAVYDAETHKCLRVYGDYPDEKAQEQAAAFALEHDTAQQNTAVLPAFLDMHLIEANLLDDGGRKHKRQEIFEYFQAHKSLAERTEFLKNSYNDIWVEVLTDGVRTGYHAEKDGLLMWEGSYLSRTSESVFSWSVITEMTEGLIERGEYKIKLGLQNAPIVAEQLALFDMGGDAPVYEAPADTATGILAPARTVPQEVIDLALCTGGNEPNSAERIAVFYMRERPEQENEEFLHREFGRANGRGIEYEGRKYAVWFLEDGIHLAQGDSVRTGYSKTVVTWEQASARILELLDAGTYLSASELAQTPDKVLHEAMDALLMTARDLNEEGRGQGLFPQTLAIHDQHKGYPELDEDMVAFAKTEGGLQTLAQEYHTFLDAYAQDRDIMRWRLSAYNTHRIGVVLDGLPYPERYFTAQPNFLRQSKMFITQDEIDHHFLNEGTESRLTIYSHFCYPHTPEERQRFIKGSFGEYSGGSRAGYGYTKTYKGLEYERDYPAANILVATRKDFETKNRKKFCGRIATGDYDAVIIGHSQFEKIPMSVERQRAILEQQIDEIMLGISEAKREKAEKFTIKQMEKTKKGLQAKIDKLNDQSRKDDVVTFEELGVDRIFIDESHYFKNLFLYTKMRNVGGIAQTEAQKSSDLFMKCRYLDEITGGRGIIFATGTPISNSMVELYTIQRYLQMSALEEQGLQHFDSWAANYGETVTAIELSPEGTGYRAKTRFAKFYNLPELMSVFKNVADIQTADMLKLPVPEAHYHNIALKPSEYQKEIVASLAERAEKVRNREVDSSVDNMLLITNDGRKLALDQRLVNPMLPSDPNSKAAKCAENVFEIWQRTAGQRSTQMIFCDLSTPKDDGTFSVYDDIHAKLLELGIPENEIAFIHNAKSEAQKKDLFGKVRSGQVRILLGSTQRMGAGTNCQQKLIALHHLDCPWRPSDLQQREGRIIRQGNENSEVDIYSYVTEGTFDAYLYQLVESKQKFISQIMTSKSPVRSAEDVDEQALSYAEIKALASGNPMIKEKMDLDIEVSKLKLLKANHLSQKYALEDAISKGFPKQIAETQARIAGYGADIAAVKENTHPNGDGFSPLTLAGVTHADKKEAGAALLTMCQTMLSPEATQIGSYRGLTLELAFDTFAREYRLTMIGQLRHTVTLGTDVFGNLQRMDNALEGLPIKEQTCREQLSNLQTQLETAKAEVQKPFPREEELTTKTARLEELNTLLNLDHKEPEIVDTEPDEDQRAPERRRPQLER